LGIFLCSFINENFVRNKVFFSGLVFEFLYI
jgi:hypothetical protein